MQKLKKLMKNGRVGLDEKNNVSRFTNDTFYRYFFRKSIEWIAKKYSVSTRTIYRYL